jgi:hypothetical protein
MASLSLEHGNSDGSCLAYVWVGSVTAGPRLGDYQAAFRFCQLGYDLVEQRGLKRFQAKTYSCNPLNTNLLAAGDPLDEVQGEAERGLAFARKMRFGRGEGKADAIGDAPFALDDAGSRGREGGLHR